MKLKRNKISIQQTILSQGNNRETMKKLADLENIIKGGSDLMNRINKILHVSNDYNSGWSSERSIHSFANLPDIKLHWKLKKTLSKPNYFEPNLNNHSEVEQYAMRK